METRNKRKVFQGDKCMFKVNSKTQVLRGFYVVLVNFELIPVLF